MKVLSVSELYAVLNWRGDVKKELIGEEILIVNRKNNFIVGKVKLLEPPKKHTAQVTYYLPKEDNEKTK